ncbi:MAG: hypothetical protein H6632_19040 [Anaerolineales bacterium]|nr:hypothetical protein [Anaerolineales bacterium]
MARTERGLATRLGDLDCHPGGAVGRGGFFGGGRRPGLFSAGRFSQAARPFPARPRSVPAAATARTSAVTEFPRAPTRRL